MQRWWEKLVAPVSRNDTHQKTADEPAECAPQYRLESLEPRLLLSADPISAELARVVQEDAQSNDADAVAAIVQEIDSIAESNSAEHSNNGRGGLKFSWPEEWNPPSNKAEDKVMS